MITVPEAVLEIIHRTPFIEEALSQKLINISGLAREIKTEVEEKTMKEVQLGSIIMALKRMSSEFKKNSKFNTTFNSTPDLIVRSNLFEITVQNSESQIQKHKLLLEYAGLYKSAFMTVTHGVFETTIIANTELKENIDMLYKDEKIISRLDNLSSITVKFPQNIIEVPGIYYLILKSIAWDGISITEVVSTYSEITIILKHEYVDRSFSLIKKLFK